MKTTEAWLTEFDPTPAEIQEILKARKSRQYQHRSRGDKHSAADKVIELRIILALEAGQITEGIAAKLLTDGDRVALREKRLRAIAIGRTLAHALRILG